MTREQIESLGWRYLSKSMDDWYAMNVNIQPFRLTYRHIRLTHNNTDGRIRIIGYEHNERSEEEILLVGRMISENPVKELRTTMNQIGIYL